MKVRIVALAGVSLLAFTLAASAQQSGGSTSGGSTSSGMSAPAMQPPPPPPPPPAAAPMMGEWMTQGWYFGAGAGYDRMDQLEVIPAGSYPLHVSTNNDALITGTFGYRFPDRLRLEGEFGWDQHGLGDNVGGHFSLWSLMANVAYDFPLSPKWDYTIGAGAGIGNGTFDVGGLTSSTRQGYMWQAFTGFDYWLRRDISLNLDWRYRSLAETENFTLGGGTFNVKQTNEQALMLSVRWYPWAAPPPPPPPAPPPPPPPPPPPVMAPPTKTFIVFFDFNKANLTAEAEAVVSEAVKTAKSNGFVKVLVTGHTDTVGSDSYNQGLSVRRAESVKDEMVREGMDGSTISIEGKSFHDPLVPTGPGVREPQNRRAVIDLGG